jgi:hypothetical protein
VVEPTRRPTWTAAHWGYAVNADNGQVWTASNDVEAQMLAAVRNADDIDYFAALRSAQFVMPVHTATGQAQLLTLDFDGQLHSAVFTSVQLARRGIEQFIGDTSGWHDATYKADEFASAFADDDLRVLLNPGTPIQTSFTVPELVGSWTAIGPAVPRRRRGSWKWALYCLIAALVLFVVGGNLLSGTVTCGSQVMDADDTCVATANGDSTEETFQQTQLSQNWLALGLLAGAAVSAVAAAYHVVARMATRARREDRVP